jgi:hypothetical protein
MKFWPHLRSAAFGLWALAWALQGSVAASVCQSGRVEMIVGGVAQAADCPARAAARPFSTGHAASIASTGERIDPAVQRERDSDRRRILEEELAKEQAVLTGLIRPGTAADPATVARTQANVAALRQELARTSP